MPGRNRYGHIFSPGSDEEEKPVRPNRYAHIAGDLTPRGPGLLSRLGSKLKRASESGVQSYRSQGGVSGPAIDLSEEQEQAKHEASLQRMRTASPGYAALTAFGHGLTSPIRNVVNTNEEKDRAYGLVEALPEPEGLGGHALRTGSFLAGSIVPYIAASVAGAPALAAIGSSARVAAATPRIAKIARGLGQTHKWTTNVARGTLLVSPVNALQSLDERTAGADALAQFKDLEGEGAAAEFGRKVGGFADRFTGSTAGRFAFETGLDLVAGGVVEKGLDIGRRALASRAATQGAKAEVLARGALGQDRVVRQRLGTANLDVARPEAPIPAAPPRFQTGQVTDLPEIDPMIAIRQRASEMPIPDLGQAPRVEPLAPRPETPDPIMPQGRARPGQVDAPVTPVQPRAERTAWPEPEVIQATSYQVPDGWEKRGPDFIFKEGQRAAQAEGLRPPKTVGQARGILRELETKLPAELQAPADLPPLTVGASGVRRTPVEPPAPQPPTSGTPQQAIDAPAPSSRAREYPENPKADPQVRAVVSGYMDRAKVDGRRLPHPDKVDAPKAEQMAKVYEGLKSTPDDPEVRAAYKALADETRAQYEEIQKAGYTIEFVDADPYKTSKEMMEDVRNNKTLKVYRTAEDQAHPILTREENDLFRAVHDFFGHNREGNQFGPLGEERAFRDHSEMFSPLARRAMATETRGQNSWVNYGPQAKGKAPADRPFATQKAALWPEELLGDYADMPSWWDKHIAEIPGTEAVARAKAHADKVGATAPTKPGAARAYLRGLPPGELAAMGGGTAAGLALEQSEDEGTRNVGTVLKGLSVAAMAPSLAKAIARPTTKRAFADAVKASAETNGFSFDIQRGALVRDGWLVGGVAKPMLVKEVTPDILEQAANKFAKELEQKGTILGGWFDKSKGRYVIEPATVFPQGKRLQATQAAVDRGEQAVGHLKDGKYDETTILRHHTDTPDMTQVDPAFMGQGKHAGAERSRKGRVPSVHFYKQGAKTESFFEDLPAVYTAVEAERIVDLSDLKALAKQDPELADLVRTAKRKGDDAVERVLADRDLLYTTDGRIVKGFNEFPVFRVGETPPSSKPLGAFLRHQVAERVPGAQETVTKGNQRVIKAKDAIVPEAKGLTKETLEKGYQRAKKVYYDRLVEGLQNREIATRMWFYSRRLVEANKLLVKKFPEMADKSRLTIYNVIRAMTSANTSPFQNEDMAASLYARWRFGKVGGGLRADAPGIPGHMATKANTVKLQQLEADWRRFVDEAGGDEQKGTDAFAKWLIELRDTGPAVDRGGKEIAARQLPNAMEYLGQSVDTRKTSNYFMNLNGFTDNITTDVHHIRNVRSLLGYAKEKLGRVDKGGGKYETSTKWTANDKPDIGEIRAAEYLTRRFSEDMRADLGLAGEKLTPREVQALMWYIQKGDQVRFGTKDGGFDDYFAAWQKFNENPFHAKVLNKEFGDLALQPKVKGKPYSTKVWGDQLQKMGPSELLRRAAWHAKEYGGTAPKTVAKAREYLLNVPPGQTAMMGGGAALGALVDDENRLRGAAIGAGGELALRAMFKRGAKAADKAGLPKVPEPTLREQVTKNMVRRSLAQAKANAAPTKTVRVLERKLRTADVGTPKDEPILTPAAMALDPSGEQWAKELAAAAKAGKSRVTMTLEEQAKEANFLSWKELLSDDRVARTAPELAALTGAMVDGKNRAIKITQQIKNLPETAGVEARLRLEQELDAAMTQVSAAMTRVGQGASEAGRTLRAMQALEFFAANTDDVGFWLQAARKQAGLPAGVELDPKVVKAVGGVLAGAKKDANGHLTQESVDALVKAVRGARPNPGLVRKLVELTRIGLLTLPATHVANVIGNTIKAGFDQGVVRPTASLLDFLLTPMSKHGQRTTTTSAAIKSGYGSGLKQGGKDIVGGRARNAWTGAKTLGDKLRASKQAVKHVIEGMHDDNVVKILGSRGINWGEGPVGTMLNTYQGLVYGGLGSQDKLFRQAAVGAALRERAEVRALNAGLKRNSKDWDETVRFYQTEEGMDPRDLAEAILEGELAVFTEPSKLAQHLNAIKKIPMIGVVAETFMPFVLTPTNIVRQAAVDYSPLQLGRVLFGKSGAFAKEGWRHSPEAQRKVVQAMGKGLVGTSLLGAGALLFLNDRITGPQPKDANEAQLNKQRGVPYNSVKIGDGWINVARLGPVGLILVMGGELARGLEDGNITASALAIPRAASELPMLQGVKDVADALSSDSRADQKVLQIGGSLMGRLSPSLVGGIARGTDDVGTRQKDVPLDYLKDRVPGWRQTLPARKTPLGQDDAPRSLATEMFLPGWRVERNDRVTRELTKLNLGVQDINRDEDVETQREFERRRLAGNKAARDAVLALTRDAAYRRMSSTDRRDAVRRAISTARAAETRRLRSS